MAAMTLRRLLILLLCFALVSAGPSAPLRAEPAAESAAPATPASEVEITVTNTGFSGKISDVGGKSARKGTKIEIRDPDTGKVIAKTTTDKQGNYSFSALNTGKYDLLINGKKLGILNVVSASTIDTVNLVVPSAVLSAGAKSALLVITLVTLGVAGTTVAILYGTDVLGDDDDSDRPATPVNP